MKCIVRRVVGNTIVRIDTGYIFTLVRALVVIESIGNFEV